MKYYENNVIKTFRLLEFLRHTNIQGFIFSSSAAVYGEPTSELITENHTTNPITPYGRSKLMIEMMLQDMSSAYDFNSVSLRYFNAAGAHPDGHLAERHLPETHLIPLLIEVACGKRPLFSLYGDNYPTPDGSCVRDFIHVMDLAAAHYAALEYLCQNGQTTAFNVGSGRGFSVKETIAAFEKVSQQHVPVQLQAPRVGDPAYLVADPQLLQATCQWQPAYSDLDTILQHAWLAQKPLHLELNDV